MNFDLITIFPDFFRGPLDCGIVRRAREAGLVEIALHDLRNFTHDRHRTVDDRPFGGGEGMVLKPEPIFECVESLGLPALEERRQPGARSSVVLLSPQGEVFTQAAAQQMASLERIVLICGRYEGVDERVAEFLADRELSVGNFVLSGGELAAAIVVDAVTRLLPGALGNENSARQESFTVPGGQGPVPQGLSANRAGEAGQTGRDTGYTEGSVQSVGTGQPAPDSTCSSEGLLDYPHYTRPADFRGMRVPDVLVGGNHEQIRNWRRERARQKTERNRPDLLGKGSC